MRTICAAETVEVAGGVIGGGGSNDWMKPLEVDNWDAQLMGDWSLLSGPGCSMGIEIVSQFAGFLAGRLVPDQTINRIISVVTGQDVSQNANDITRNILNSLTAGGAYCGPQDPFAGGSPG
jgi:hypothetical protein